MSTSKPVDPSINNITKHFRLICFTCGKRGNWTLNFEEAKADAIAHKEEEPEHDVDIDIENSIQG
jgi:hypothetical protein